MSERAEKILNDLQGEFPGSGIEAQWYVGSTRLHEEFGDSVRRIMQYARERKNIELTFEETQAALAKDLGTPPSPEVKAALDRLSGKSAA